MEENNKIRVLKKVNYRKPKIIKNKLIFYSVTCEVLCILCCCCIIYLSLNNFFIPIFKTIVTNKSISFSNVILLWITAHVSIDSMLEYINVKKAIRQKNIDIIKERCLNAICCNSLGIILFYVIIYF